MTSLDDAIDVHMAHLVFEEHRPFSYKDFLHFEVDGTEYKMMHGTFRNKISRLVKKGAAEHAYNSGIAFYTLPGTRFGKPMTANHMGVMSSSDPIVKLIRNLPLEKSALHDINLRFQGKGYWSLLSANPIYRIHPISKDILLPSFEANDLMMRTTVHKTDTVTVVVGCSYAPIVVDINGVIRLTNALTRIEERMIRLMEDRIAVQGLRLQKTLTIPEHNNWLVTMWHFGADASIEYTGEKFCATWEVGQRELIRIYSKDFPGAVGKDGGRAKSKTKVRVELQQYPQSKVGDTIRNIIQNNHAGCW
jgi:hypothetical protein